MEQLLGCAAAPFGVGLGGGPGWGSGVGPQNGLFGLYLKENSAIIWRFRLKSVNLQREILLKSVVFDIKNQLKSVDCHVV